VLVELDVESGLRSGELTELRVRDFTAATRMLTVARAVVEINARFRDPDAPRFVVKDYPKDKEYRRVKLSPEIAAALAHHIDAHGLGRDDLLFAMPTPEPPLDAATVDETPGRASPPTSTPPPAKRRHARCSRTTTNTSGPRPQRPRLPRQLSPVRPRHPTRQRDHDRL
jgi:integrase